METSYLKDMIMNNINILFFMVYLFFKRSVLKKWKFSIF